MIDVPKIPVELIPDRLARYADVSPRRAAAFLEMARGSIRPAGRFEELTPSSLFTPDLIGAGWGDTVVVGLCGLGPAAWKLRPPETDYQLWKALTGLALRDALDFLEYRVRLFLKPTGKTPGPRLIPSCADLPIQAEQPILDRLGPAEQLGLVSRPDGHLDGMFGVAFLYPASETAVSKGRCDVCARKDCPTRILAEN